jgi:hypothetical protein
MTQLVPHLHLHHLDGLELEPHRHELHRKVWHDEAEAAEATAAQAF